MSSFIRHLPEGDTRERMVCSACGYVAYENPKVVVGSVVVAPDGRILMCRRAIEPRKGFWTLPAGYLELGETLEEGAAREALEEAEAVITMDGILGVFSIARIGQVQVIRARFSDPGPPVFGAGSESLEVRLFRPDEIPRDEIAFPSVHWALNAWQEVGSGSMGRPAGNPADDQRGVHRLTPPQICSAAMNPPVEPMP
jgi:ADP-ribose pyrophosphatase YjhB (NUDIX family)